jgi:hypothetical protein
MKNLKVISFLKRYRNSLRIFRRILQKNYLILFSLNANKPISGNVNLSTSTKALNQKNANISANAKNNSPNSESKSHNNKNNTQQNKNN